MGTVIDVGEEESVALAVVEAVAAREGSDEDDLPPLDDVLDADALDALFATRPGGDPRRGGRVVFTYCDYTVTVEDDARVRVEG